MLVAKYKYMKNLQEYSPTVLRLGIGILFTVAGLMKLKDPGAIIGMLDKLGYPAAAFLGWSLLLSEIIFGLAVLIGYKVKYMVWPLIMVLVMAAITVHFPGLRNGAPMADIMLLFHLLGLTALVSLFVAGAGKLAIKK